MSTCRELAARISAHLKRWEADSTINTKDAKYGTSRFYRAGAYSHGGWVTVTYVGYQGQTSLRKADAERYLAKIEAGFVGRHFEAFRGDE